MSEFSHLSRQNRGMMVDVGQKQDTVREATVCGSVSLSQECTARLGHESVREIVTTARLAGIQAAKQTSRLIPYCHPLFLSKIDVECELEGREFQITATTKTTGKTGVEMEALVAAQIAGATIYDMIKAVNPDAIVGPFSLVKKTGGKNGLWERPQ